VRRKSKRALVFHEKKKKVAIRVTRLTKKKENREGGHARKAKKDSRRRHQTRKTVARKLLRGSEGEKETLNPKKHSRKQNETSPARGASRCKKKVILKEKKGKNALGNKVCRRAKNRLSLIGKKGVCSRLSGKEARRTEEPGGGGSGLVSLGT